jgi:glycine cleavage system pyridoxal-binding protein P
MSSTKTKLTLGLLAGAAVAAFAISKLGQDSLKKLSERTSGLRDSLNEQLSELQNFKRTDKRFI